MRVVVTGATGFAGKWLLRELADTGHEAIGTPPSTDLDVTNATEVSEFIAETRPDAVAHLAGLTSSARARHAPDEAMRVNIAGTQSLVEAIRKFRRQILLLIVSSSEVYGHPGTNLPITELAPLRALHPYGLSKLAQEGIGFEGAVRFGIPLVVARPFSHTGPGQRPDFVMPSIARRIVEARSSGATSIMVGNVDVRRDMGDVRDVVRAYRMLLEGLHAHTIPPMTVANVASGRSIPIRELIAVLCRLAGVDLATEVDASLVRADDPAVIEGDASLLRQLTGWSPTFEVSQTLAALLEWIETPQARRGELH